MSTAVFESSRIICDASSDEDTTRSVMTVVGLMLRAMRLLSNLEGLAVER